MSNTLVDQNTQTPQSKHGPRPLNLVSSSQSMHRKSQSVTHVNKRTSKFRSSISITSPWKNYDNTLPPLNEENHFDSNVKSPVDLSTLFDEPFSTPTSQHDFTFPRRLSFTSNSSCNSPHLPSSSFTRHPSRSPSLSINTSSPQLYHPHSPSLSSPSPLPRTSSTTNVTLINTPTFADSNTHLLVTIAEKERKILEIKEELKRHEEELENLKRQWEENMTKMVPSESLSKDDKKSKRRSLINLSLGSSSLGNSELSSPTSRSPIPSFTHDPTSPALRTGKKIVDHLGRGFMEIIGNLAAPLEDEPETKLTSTAILSSSTGNSLTTTLISEQEHIPNKKGIEKERRLITDNRRSKQDTSSTSSIESFASSISAPKTPIEEKNVLTHKRRSTMDFAALAGRNAWSNVTTSINNISKSEPFQISKRRTMQLVDTFERTLTGVMDYPSNREKSDGELWVWEEEEEQKEQNESNEVIVGGVAGAVIKNWFDTMNTTPDLSTPPMTPTKKLISSKKPVKND